MVPTLRSHLFSGCLPSTGHGHSTVVEVETEKTEYPCPRESLHSGEDETNEKVHE